jgi:hypothetical protein
LPVRTEGGEEKKRGGGGGGYWMLQPRFVEHNGKRERKI